MANPLAPLLTPLAWAIFIGAVLLAITVGVVLAYHWFRYTMNPTVAMTATVTYAVVSGFLLSGILAAAIAIQLAY